MPRSFRAVDRCRVCGSAALLPVLDLGELPLANAFVRPDDVDAPEETYPLAVIRCSDCRLVQLSVVVSPESLFRNYLYASSASPPLRTHFDEYAAEVVERFAAPGSLVVEIGSNDGVLLRPLSDRGVRVLGIEPASNLAHLANESGLETRNEFFGSDLARQVAAERGPAAAVLANNVLAHIDDVADVTLGLDALLHEDGVFVAEVPYLVDLIENVEYDTIYHEHLSYFALGPLARLFARAQLEIFDARRLPIHGGSLRIFVGRAHRRPLTPALLAALESERHLGLDRPETYDVFAKRVAASRDALRQFLGDLRAHGRRVAAIGATAKGNTLLNYCDLSTREIEYIADSTSLKQGLLTPGAHIPVRPERYISDDRPDYTLLLAWNYADSIARRFQEYVRAGGRFIHPLPVAHLLGA